MDPDFEEIADIRLSALEMIIEKMLAREFAALTPEQSRQAKEDLIASAARPGALRGPELVDRRRSMLLSGRVAQLLEAVAIRERDFRRR